VPDRFAKLIDQLDGRTETKDPDRADGQAENKTNESK
jgi:hypothetical protein